MSLDLRLTHHLRRLLLDRLPMILLELPLVLQLPILLVRALEELPVELLDRLVELLDQLELVPLEALEEQLDLLEDLQVEDLPHLDLLVDLLEEDQLAVPLEDLLVVQQVVLLFIK